MLFLDYILITGAQIDPGHSEEKIIPLGPRNHTLLEGSISMLNHCRAVHSFAVDTETAVAGILN